MMPVELNKLTLASEKFNSLSPADRYVFALVGHVFNELMALQKLIYASRPTDDAHRFVAEAGVAMAFTLLRLLAGKTHEAMDIFSKPATRNVLREKYFRPVDGLMERWDETVQQYDRLGWLRAIRNQRAFHYMTQGQWASELRDGACTDGYVIVGRRQGDTLFYWNETRAAIPMLNLVNQEAPLEGLETMVNELGVLVAEILGCLATGAQFYMREFLTDEDALGPAEEIDAPDFHSFKLPYFFS